MKSQQTATNIGYHIPSHLCRLYVLKVGLTSLFMVRLKLVTCGIVGGFGNLLTVRDRDKDSHGGKMKEIKDRKGYYTNQISTIFDGF